MKIGKHEIISIFKNPKYVENIFNIMINLFKSSLYGNTGMGLSFSFQRLNRACDIARVLPFFIMCLTCFLVIYLRIKHTLIDTWQLPRRWCFKVKLASGTHSILIAISTLWGLDIVLKLKACIHFIESLSCCFIQVKYFISV